MQQSSLKESRKNNNGHNGSHGKPKFQQERVDKVNKNALTALNAKQQKYIDSLEDGVSVIVATGFPGSSKTFIPTKFACQKLLLDRLYKLVLTRPAISNSKSLGYFAGSLEEKISIWLAPVLSTVKETLGREAASIAIKYEDITFIPLEVIKGTSLSSNDPNRRIIFLVDEAEDLSKEEVIKIVTRIGKNCTLVLAGDILQSELKENSGLLWLINFIKNNNLPDFVHIDFNDVNDIVRSDTVKRFITCLQRENKKQNESQKSGSNGSHS